MVSTKNPDPGQAVPAGRSGLAPAVIIGLLFPVPSQGKVAIWPRRIHQWKRACRRLS